VGLASSSARVRFPRSPWRSQGVVPRSGGWGGQCLQSVEGSGERGCPRPGASSAIWSVAVFDPALSGRSIPASASGVISQNAN
jgi:hypothetical protein